MDPSNADLCCRAASAPSTRSIDDGEIETGALVSSRLADGDHHGNSGFEKTDGRPTRGRKLASVPSEQDEVDPGTQTPVQLSPEMKVVDFVRLVNSCGFGQVLTERGVLRQRRAFQGVDAGRGRINVVEFIAAICSRRRRKRFTDDLSVHDLQALLENQNYRCALTGEPLTPENLALDHIVPISEGGTFDIHNSQFVTRAVNRAKHTMRQNEFIDLCRNVSCTASVGQ